MLPFIESRRAEVAALCRPLGVRRLDLFGSAASGSFDPSASDIDFLVEFENMEPVAYADAWLILQEKLTLLFGRPVDLVTLASVRNTYFLESALSERETLYAA